MDGPESQQQRYGELQASPAPHSFEEFRGRMPVTETWAYFDHAAVAPLPAPVRDAIASWADVMALEGVTAWPLQRERIEVARDRAARLLGAHPDEIGFISNTTHGISLVAEGFPFQPGDNVVVPSGEFPSNVYPWANLASRGVELRTAEVCDERLAIADLERCCDHRTRLVAVSWVGYGTGYRNDLDALAEWTHRRGALLCVDAIQGLGVLPLDLSRTPVDFLAADGHKWLLGPEGAGVLFIRRERLDLLRPLLVGWNSVRQAGRFSDLAFDLKASAGRYEGGTYSMSALAGLGASLEFLEAWGTEALGTRLLEVTDQMVERLRSIGATIFSERGTTNGCDRRSGIVSFLIPNVNPLRVRAHCLERGVVLNCRQRRLRVSPHVYTNPDDIERLVAALRTAPSGG